MWRTAYILGYKCVAKIYENGSRMGIGGGRISKLEVYDRAHKMVLHYERGWDFNHLPDWVTHMIVTALQHLF